MNTEDGRRRRPLDPIRQAQPGLLSFQCTLYDVMDVDVHV